MDKYKQYGETGKIRTEKLVNNYLDAVINSCGAENVEVAKLVLSLLIDEKNNTRPLKTKLEISEALRGLEIEKKEQKLDLTLKIFVLSGLVMLLPEKPTDRYQLVHDYLVEVICKQEGDSLFAKLKQLEAEKEQEKIAKLRWLKGLQIASVTLMIVSGFALKFGIDANKSAKRAINQEVMALSNSANTYHALKPQLLDQLVEALKAGKNVQQNPRKINFTTKRLATLMLHQSLYDGLTPIFTVLTNPNQIYFQFTLARLI